MVPEELIRNEFCDVARKYSKLNPPEKITQGWIIRGAIDVLDDEGGYWDTYEVCILIPLNYPNVLPQLFESSGKILRTEDWHNSNGLCCLGTEAIMYYRMGGQVTLVKWIEQFAHPYLANHIYKLKTGSYAQGEFSHGVPGLIEGYTQIWGLKNEVEVINYLKFVTNIKSLKRNDPCFCKSGKKYKHCYLVAPKKHFMGIPVNLIQDDLQKIESYIVNL